MTDAKDGKKEGLEVRIKPTLDTEESKSALKKALDAISDPLTQFKVKMTEVAFRPAANLGTDLIRRISTACNALANASKQDEMDRKEDRDIRKKKAEAKNQNDRRLTEAQANKIDAEAALIRAQATREAAEAIKTLVNAGVDIDAKHHLQGLGLEGGSPNEKAKRLEAQPKEDEQLVEKKLREGFKEKSAE